MANKQTTTDLASLGLRDLPAQLDDFLARATNGRWTPLQVLQHLAEGETGERARSSLERRLRRCGLKNYKPMADFEWNWPKRIERETVERAFTLEFLARARDLILIGPNGLGKTMIAKNLCHAVPGKPTAQTSHLLQCRTSLPR